MRLLKWLLVFVIIGIIVWAFLPVDAFGGEPTYDIEVSMRLNQQKPLEILTLGILPSYTIDEVTWENKGVSKNIDLRQSFFIAEIPTVWFCIDGEDNCQTNSETFLISLGEQRITSETIHKVPSGDHMLEITVLIDGSIRASYSEMITV
jgi:hypothetical protein